MVCACVRAQIDQKPGGNKSSGHRSAVHPNVVHLLCEVCWCVCAVRESGNRSTKPSGKKPSGHRIAGHSMCLHLGCVWKVCVCGKCECVCVCVCQCSSGQQFSFHSKSGRKVRVDSKSLTTHSMYTCFAWSGQWPKRCNERMVFTTQSTSQELHVRLGGQGQTQKGNPIMQDAQQNLITLHAAT